MTDRAVVARCVTCGEQFDSYPKAERHVDREHGHGRIDTLPPRKGTTP